MSERFQSFEEFWPYYVGEHKNSTCRTLHYIGTTLALLNLGALLVTVNPLFLLTGLVSSYGFAWAGHFFVEKNKPATFTYPFWSLAADFRMYSLALMGRMSEEVERLHGETSAQQQELAQKA